MITLIDFLRDAIKTQKLFRRFEIARWTIIATARDRSKDRHIPYSTFSHYQVHC